MPRPMPRRLARVAIPRSLLAPRRRGREFPLKDDKVTPDEPEEHHLNDVAIQAWVMESSGLSLTRAEINYLNSRWKYPGNGDYSGLFRQMDVSAEVAVRKQQVPIWLQQAQTILSADMPAIPTGKQCKDPYDCPFLPYCKKLDPLGPEHPIELLPDSAGKRLAKKLRESKGFCELKSFSELAECLHTKVMPLLQEYFHEDWKKIRLVLKDGPGKDKALHIVKEFPVDPSKLFGELGSELETRYTYLIVEELSLEMVQAIYQ